MTVNTIVRHFFENSSQTTDHAASSHPDQACEITADSAVEVTAKALVYIFIFLVSFFGNIFFLCGHLQEEAATKIHQLLCFQHGCIRPLQQPFDHHYCEDR